MKENVLHQKIDQLTPEEQEQVLRLVDNFLEKKNINVQQHIPQFNWAGGLAHLKDQYTSVQLQKKINEWW